MPLNKSAQAIGKPEAAQLATANRIVLGQPNLLKAMERITATGR